MTLWLFLGWLLFGGALGYATVRWRFVYVVFLALFGLSLITAPEPPELLVGASSDGTWGETLAFVGGLIAGGRIAKRTR